MITLAIRYGFLALLVGLVAFFGVAADGFAGPHSAVFVFQSVAITGILALGVTCTLVVGGFDLSIGSVATSALMLSSYVMVVWEQGAWLAILLCLAMGALVGAVNGWLVVRMKVPDLLATLGTMFLLIGLQRIPTEGRSITRSKRWRPSARKARENVPSATVPSGSVMPVAIERPSVGMRWRPISRNIVPSVARRSGTRMRTTRKPFTAPTPAPIARQSPTASHAPCSHTTMT